jgi:hypothetical protein
MAAEPACASCRWRRLVPGPTPLGEGPYHWCGNISSYHFTRPVTGSFVCEKYRPRAPLPEPDQHTSCSRLMRLQLRAVQFASHAASGWEGGRGFEGWAALRRPIGWAKRPRGLLKPRDTMTGKPPTEIDDFRRDQIRLQAIQCPHCDEVTMPNLLLDGSVICSCTAERGLPLYLLQGTPWDGMETTMPSPVDDGGFGDRGLPEHRKPDGTDQAQLTKSRDNTRPKLLPGDHGQFGRDVTTEAYPALNSDRMDQH